MATVALSALRTKLQTLLKDTAARKWSADDLDTYINMALVQWTTDLPIASSNSYTVVADQNAYDLPENAISVSWVYGYFEGTAQQEFLSPMTLRPGAWPINDEPRRYIVGFPLDTQFYLPREPGGSTFTLYYMATHTELSSDTDTLDLRTFRWGEQAVLAYAAYLAHKPYSASRARLRQWARRPDVDTGNPLEDQAQGWLEMYEDLIEKYAEPITYEFIRMPRT